MKRNLKLVAKYNICKCVSTILTIGTPIIALIASGIEIVNPAGKMSVSACIICLIVLLFLKDKIAENLKFPSAFVLSIVLLALIIVIENILIPLKGILIVTIIMSGIDEITFKRIYKETEQLMPQRINAFKHFGFICTTSDKLEELRNV